MPSQETKTQYCIYCFLNNTAYEKYCNECGDDEHPWAVENHWSACYTPLTLEPTDFPFDLKSLKQMIERTKALGGEWQHGTVNDQLGRVWREWFLISAKPWLPGAQGQQMRHLINGEWYQAVSYSLPLGETPPGFEHGGRYGKWIELLDKPVDYASGDLGSEVGRRLNDISTQVRPAEEWSYQEVRISKTAKADAQRTEEMITQIREAATRIFAQVAATRANTQEASQTGVLGELNGALEQIENEGDQQIQQVLGARMEMLRIVNDGHNELLKAIASARAVAASVSLDQQGGEWRSTPAVLRRIAGGLEEERSKTVSLSLGWR